MATSSIGVLSDTHNNAANTEAALALFRNHHVQQLIHCGDVTSPIMLEQFGGFRVWLVRGNNDYDWLFRGHSHRHELEQIGRTKVLNPGALGGRHPSGEDRGVAIVDLAHSQARFYTL